MKTTALLTEFVTQDIVAYLVQEQGMDIADALQQYYDSQFYIALTDSKTGLYCEGSAHLYELYKLQSIQGGVLKDNR